MMAGSTEETLDFKRPVFLDTNSINKDSLTPGVFGKRSLLTSVAASYSIKIPRVVFDELQEHRRRKFETERKSLLGNSIARRMNLDFGAVEKQCFDDINNEIIAEETIPYEICELEEPEAFLATFYGLAIRHDPPFDAGSDKGFKDACIASVINKYLYEHQNVDFVILVTRDERLKDFFDDNSRVKTYGKLEDLISKQVEAAEEPQHDDGLLHASAESGQPAVNAGEIDAAIKTFCASGSFASTHNAVAKLAPLACRLNEDEKLRIVRAATTNDQISYILRDYDVRSFILPLFYEVGSRLSDRDYRVFVNAAGIPDNRLDSNGNPMFSSAEQCAYTRLVDGLISHIIERGWSSTTESDPDVVIECMRTLLAESSLDPKALTWQAVVRVFLHGYVSVTPGLATRDAVSDFVDMLEACNSLKRATVMRLVSARLGSVEMGIEEIPF